MFEQVFLDKLAQLESITGQHDVCDAVRQIFEATQPLNEGRIYPTDYNRQDADSFYDNAKRTLYPVPRPTEGRLAEIPRSKVRGYLSNKSDKLDEFYGVTEEKPVNIVDRMSSQAANIAHFITDQVKAKVYEMFPGRCIRILNSGAWIKITYVPSGYEDPDYKFERGYCVRFESNDFDRQTETMSDYRVRVYEDGMFIDDALFNGSSIYDAVDYVVNDFKQYMEENFGID